MSDYATAIKEAGDIIDKKNRDIETLLQALKDIKQHVQVSSPTMAQYSAVYNIAARAIGEMENVK